MLEDKVSSTQIIRAAEDRLLWHSRKRRPPTTILMPLRQFLGAISRSLGAHTAAFDVMLDASGAEDDDDDQQQQSTQQDMTVRGRQRHAVFVSSSSLHALASPSYRMDILGSVPIVPRLSHWQQLDSCCPICRSPIQIVLRVFN